MVQKSSREYFGDNGGGKGVLECFEKLHSSRDTRTTPEIFPEAEECSDTGMLTEKNGYYLEPVVINGKEEYIVKSKNLRLQAQLLSGPKFNAK
ncbi:hypothetical protein Aduo_016774 [Ancylostoma duodenale]